MEEDIKPDLDKTGYKTVDHVESAGGRCSVYIAYFPEYS
jgi:hypothetical protein